jgi:hypothetical protein
VGIEPHLDPDARVHYVKSIEQSYYLFDYDISFSANASFWILNKLWKS